MPLQKPDFQLQLELDLELGPTEEGVGNSALSGQEIRLRAETARGLLDGTESKEGAPGWMDEYFNLREGGWPWRVAAYIAWASSPREGREPKTQDELAKRFLGLTSDRAIATWRKKNPVIDETVAIMQASILFKNRTEIYAALIAVATEHNYKSHNDRKLALELMGDYVPSSKITAEMRKMLTNVDLDEMSDAEIDELIGSMKSVIEKKKNHADPGDTK